MFDLRLSVGLMLRLRACLHWNAWLFACLACTIAVSASTACAHAPLISAVLLCSLLSALFSDQWQRVTRGCR